MTILAQFALFLSSYAPLFGVFALLDSFSSDWSIKLFVALACLGPVLLVAVLVRAAMRIGSQELRVQSVVARDGDALAYIATYLVPFAAISAHSNRERAALALFLILVAIVYIRSELFYVNPLLALAGFRLFEISTASGTSAVLMTRRRFVPASSALRTRRLGEYVHWEASSE